MVPRYSRPQMEAIWSPAERYRIWFQIEALAAEAMAALGTIPADAAQAIRDKGAPRAAAIGDAEVARIDEIERVTRHDVIAFLTFMAEGIGESARFMHQGMTSSDVLDTCLAVQMTRAADLLIADLDAVLAALKARAIEHRMTPTVGRSHGIHAEPTTFGLKLAGHYAEFARGRARLVAARAEVATCAISGPVGTFASVDPRVEAFVAERLGLAVEPVSTQVIPRDRHAAFFCALALVASAVERLATEVRHLQRSEVREAEEYFHPGQKGSSAMPHKRNPVLSENLTGLARLVRGYVTPALENVALWHERDISHSSVERVIAPDATIALDFALMRLAGMMEKLTIYPARMQANLDALGGVVHSQKVLLALTQAGMSREDAYAAVQRAAMATWQALGSAGARDFRANLAADAEVTRWLDAAAIDAAMDAARDFRHVETVFARVFGEA
ncbi:adenylosuccinate lyase [Roseomonas sp. CECT 9278]|uniref:adenylosuccinate lyase n=1 Tax=Roseomonas sp. CECT 9278 TaxID=2845823 RepID=UPI001E366CE6|nr:adenylosuccinate lyase [Roseomonas sp. CECT 9278]CAH0167586.1 Adenylosuccinate lyase [Roseomonas sp. CECT 9278]